MEMTNGTENDSRDMNRDPISGAPGAHPIGTGVGATGGACAGATIGSVAGPVGTVVGGAIGAVVGGLGGKAAGEAMNPTAEADHWRSTYENEPYRKQEFGYSDYEPAYKLGYSNRAQYQGQSFDQAETSLQSDWERTKGQSRLAWEDAKPATRAAWHRVERALPGDADGDGI
jgi:phage tail tape-measure protein